MSTGLFQDLEARSLVRQVTDPELANHLDHEPITVYAGFDPTADSLHIGHLLPLLTLRRFQKAGHSVIAVVGGATGMIGDPSGKSQERSLLSDSQLEANVRGITSVIQRFLDADGPNPAKILNNADWFKGLSYIGFLRDVGKHFTINHMMGKESVRARLEDRDHGISYTEFSYMLLQSYDYFVLNQNYGCRLQIGGSDQWGNITAGIDLVRRMRATPQEVYGLTQPLVTKADGTKFGKTEQGAIWLDSERTSPYQFYQFLLQSSDADVVTLLKFFTFLPIEQIHHLETQLKTAPEKREAQNALAEHLTELVHGKAALDQALHASQALFGSQINQLDRRTLLQIFTGAPSTQKPKASLNPGLAVIDLLVETGLCTSKGNARKEITGGGIYFNNERITDPAFLVTEQNLIAGEFVVLRRGKKTYHLISFPKG